MISSEHKRILIAPLDWGLGHTTRCIPIIRYLLKTQYQPVFAGNEWQRGFIKETFNDIGTIHLDGYNITYSKSANGFIFSMFRQFPRIAKTIRKEHHWLSNLLCNQSFDGIISDNRYGLYHKTIPSVFMTHQLEVQSGINSLADAILRTIHYKFINRFNTCWAVDTEDANNLSGKLAHPSVLPGHTKYIGLLSQFVNVPTVEGEHLLILLSGPEPQRSILSSLLWKQIMSYNGKVVFVEGSNHVVVRETIPAHVDYHKQLTQQDLLPLLKKASMVICRSGYSTLMDLVALGKKAIIIPTPGQTEQEYLARYLYHQEIFFYHSQKNFDLRKVLSEASIFPFKKITLENAYKAHEVVLSGWLKTL